MMRVHDALTLTIVSHARIVGTTALQGMNNRLASAFATSVCSLAVLQLVLTQLLMYYSRFILVVEKRCGTAHLGSIAH